MHGSNAKAKNFGVLMNMIQKFKWWILGLFFCVTFGVSCFFYLTTSRASSPSLFYGKIEIQKMPANIPGLEVEIENKKIPVIFDLGFSGYAMFDNFIVHEITDKNFLRQSWKYGLRGIKRYHDVYQIPKMRMGSLTYTNIEVNDRDPAFNEESVIVLDQEKYISGVCPTRGKLGWMLFNNLLLFLDMKKSKIVICGSPEKFEKEEHSLKSYTKTPLFIDRDLVEIETETPQGIVKCLLDTGCTYNIFNTKNGSDEPLGQMINDKTRFTIFDSFKIGDREFGPMSFHPAPVKLPIEIQAILGMEFFDQHRVLIDFKNRQVYFAKN
jgi:hypothetical protein